MSLRLFVFLVACCFINSALNATPDVLTLCDAVTHAANYNGRTLHIRGILVSGAEQAVLYDPKCVRDAGDTSVSLAKTFKRSKMLDRLIKKDRRAWVVVEGIFHAPELAEIDPKMPQWMQERLKGTMKRYGHLNSCTTMIEVSKIVSIEAVPPETSWQ